ncbi:diheme cytochrome c precursor [Aureliella helgolandensis]|uniref:Nitrate reductase cytochrome c-type subunit (NapB) n=1 Tax=Aureliella helgolandensis TaxID=2527968 RepID=A0A518GC76_9BACT|nr:diheme cytochrome c precursor [Aureliella helgolandensis]QDV26204.1 Nitrate reductase cytochrome c-type subunit (NapB) [Aureliella helgolandensis]
MSVDKRSNAASLIALVVVSLAVAGYFTGLQAPMHSPQSTSPLRIDEKKMHHAASLEAGVITATRYSDMAEATRKFRRQSSLIGLKSNVEPLAEVAIKPEEKFAALQRRAENRAFNGAPPTVPHPIDQRSDSACVACHGQGAKTQSLRIPRMSHTMLANCTQCHVESNALHLQSVAFRENEFEGLAAPTAGPRAYPEAPPQIPHSTWMRSNCMSCHGYAGLQGIRSTHPWRSNCQQCHAPSASLDQTLLAEVPQFLPAPQIKE